MKGRPVPTLRFVALLLLGLLPSVLALASPGFALVAAAADLAALALCALDWARTPPFDALSVRRRVEPVLSAGTTNAVWLELHARGDAPLRGVVQDAPPPGMESSGHRLRFALGDERRDSVVGYRLTPRRRGDAAFGNLHVRVEGPLGLCARQFSIPAAASVKVYPDLTALGRTALQLQRAMEGTSSRPTRRPGEGRELESLREYRPGDDARAIDWKVSARRARTMVRAYQPERHQPVLLALDCGRHMAGEVHGRRKLDYAVDGAVQLARVSLNKGDLVGVVAFGARVLAYVPPRRGAAHLRTLTSALYPLEATFEESDLGLALDTCFARHHKRTLVVVFSDLLDLETSHALVRRTMALAPRHLPLVASLHDPALLAVAVDAPVTVHGAYERHVATRLEGDQRLTLARLKDAGALVVRAPADAFSAAAVNAYLRLKAEGRL